MGLDELKDEIILGNGKNNLREGEEQFEEVISFLNTRYLK